MSLERPPTSPEKNPTWDLKSKMGVQRELMERMGINLNPADEATRVVSEEAASEWVQLHAEAFDATTRENESLQSQLLSDDETVRDSAFEELVYVLKELNESN